MKGLIATAVTVRYHGAPGPAVSGVSIDVVAGRLVALVGPNGCGKTSLLRALLGSHRVESGEVRLDGRPITEWPARARARRIGVVSQREDYPFAWRVEELVAFGRYARLSALAPLSPADRVAVERAMVRADVASLGQRRIDSLSGGEWQRVRIARALAQEPDILVLDEPTASLDLGHEMEIFELVRRFTDDGLASVIVTHHLNLAARFADRLLLMHHGRTVAEGSPAEVLTPGSLEEVFGWPVRLSAVDGAPQVVPLRRPLEPDGTG